MNEPRIIVYGHGDKSAKGFETPDDLVRYIKDDVISQNHGRYRYTQNKNVNIIVLSRDGLAFGDFEVLGREPPNEEDRADYPPVKYVYIIGNRTLYETPVLLRPILGKPVNPFGVPITAEQLGQIRSSAGLIQELPSPWQSAREEARLEIDRQRRLAEQATRPGQQQFSATLRKNYNGQCAISGCATAAALEAAHIRVQKGVDDNSLENGLLLRSDIHALFDALLITLSEDGTRVEVSAALADPCYEFLRIVTVLKPQKSPPSSTNIRDHRKRFSEKWRARGE